MKLKITCYKKTCESCDECDGIVCNEPTGATILSSRTSETELIRSIHCRTSDGCSVKKKECFK